MAKMAVGFGAPPVLTGTATDAQGNKKTVQATSFGGITDAANAFANANMPGQAARPNPGTQTYKGSVAGQQQYNTQGGGKGISFGETKYKPGVFPGSPTMKVNPVQPGMTNPHNKYPPAAAVAPMPGQNAVTDQTAAAVSSNLTQPGITEANTQGMVNKSLERLGTQRSADKVGAREAALASGFGESGGALANSMDIDDEYNTRAQGAERDIRLGAARDNASLKNSAIGLGLQYSGQQNQLAESAADRAMRQQDQDWQRQKYEEAKMPGQAATGGWGGWR